MKRNQQDFRTEKYIRYGIRKYSFGAASVAIAAGLMFLGTGAVAAAETPSNPSGDKVQVATVNLSDQTDATKESLSSVDEGTHAPVSKETVAEETVSKAVNKQTVTHETEESTKPQEAEKKEDAKQESFPSDKNTEVKETPFKSEENPSLNLSSLKEKLADLEAQIERIRGNKKQASQIQNAEKLVAEAKQYLEALDTTQKEVDAKAKEISSLTNILKSIKAEAVSKENKNKDSRNGKKMEEGTSFRTGTESTRDATTSITTGVGADVKDATETPAVKRPPYTDRKVAEGFAKQIAWLDFSDVDHWKNVEVENGTVVLKEGSEYEKEIMPDYRIKLKVK